LTPEREEEIRDAWRTYGRGWRWAPEFQGYQHLDVPLRRIAIARVDDGPIPDGDGFGRLTFTGSYATFPNGSGPNRPRYRFITCEGLIVLQERIQ